MCLLPDGGNKNFDLIIFMPDYAEQKMKTEESVMGHGYSVVFQFQLFTLAGE